MRAAAALAGGCLVLAGLPFAIGDYRAGELAGMGVYFIAILGLNLLTGYTGQISIGHGAFMLIGGYTTAILAADHGFPAWTTIPLAGVVAGVAGLAFGLPATRLAGLYLALATFGAAVALPAIADEWEGLTHGSSGLNLEFRSGRWAYGVTWSIAVALLVAAWALTRGRVGRAFRALRDSEVAATAMGVSPARYKTLAFGVSAFYAGVAGSLFALRIGFVSPQSPNPIKLSLYVLVGVAVAGLGSLRAVAVGAAFVQFVDIHAAEISRTAPAVIFGGLLVLVMLVSPGGAAGAARRVSEELARRGYTRPG